MSHPLVALFLVFILAAQSRAVIFYNFADPNHNLSAPSGSLAGAGWQYQALWNGFVTVPVGPRHFIAAGHIGGNVGDTVVYHGIPYRTIDRFTEPGHELVLWKIEGQFPSWAPLYRTGNEVGKACFFYGRGSGRGAPVTTSGGALRGWEWGPGPTTPVWGTNEVDSILDLGPGKGEMLYCTFDVGGGTEEAHLAGGDSSAPIFLFDGTDWALAGVSYGVDGPFSKTTSGSGFQAALFNVRGLYYGGEGQWTLMSFNVPSGFFASRVSAHWSWIDSVLEDENQVQDVPLLGPWAAGSLAALLLATGILKQRRAHP